MDDIDDMPIQAGQAVRDGTPYPQTVSITELVSGPYTDREIAARAVRARLDRQMRRYRTR